MNKNLIILLLNLFAPTTFGQVIDSLGWIINFDPPYSNFQKIYIDTITNSKCIWQIGRPDKTVFTSAYSYPNVIITDTLNSVPVNDTSVFYLIHTRNAVTFDLFSLLFWYQLDGDSTDRGTIEISPDNGLIWINILTQDSIYKIWWPSDKPTLSGNSNGWKYFHARMDEWVNATPGDGYFPVYIKSDTVLFRFTYITDSGPTPNDGWIIDNIIIEDQVIHGIEENNINCVISIFPNPSENVINITGAFPMYEAEFMAIHGTKILSMKINNVVEKTELDYLQYRASVDLAGLPTGLYFIRIMYENIKANNNEKLNTWHGKVHIIK